MYAHAVISRSTCVWREYSFRYMHEIYICSSHPVKTITTCRSVAFTSYDTTIRRCWTWNSRIYHHNPFVIHWVIHRFTTFLVPYLAEMMPILSPSRQKRQRSHLKSGYLKDTHSYSMHTYSPSFVRSRELCEMRNGDVSVIFVEASVPCTNYHASICEWQIRNDTLWHYIRNVYFHKRHGWFYNLGNSRCVVGLRKPLRTPLPCTLQDMVPFPYTLRTHQPLKPPKIGKFGAHATIMTANTFTKYRPFMWVLWKILRHAVILVEASVPCTNIDTCAL